MRDEDVACKAPRDPRRAAKLPGTIAQIFFATRTGGAVAAADPWKGGVAGADAHAFRVRPDGDDFAFDLMAHCVGQLQVHERQPVAAAEIEIAVVNMYVAVADAGVMDLEEHLRTAGRGRGRFDLFKGCTECDNRLRQHDLLRFACPALSMAGVFSFCSPLRTHDRRGRERRIAARQYPAVARADQFLKARGAHSRPATIASGSASASCGVARKRPG